MVLVLRSMPECVQVNFSMHATLYSHKTDGKKVLFCQQQESLSFMRREARSKQWTVTHKLWRLAGTLELENWPCCQQFGPAGKLSKSMDSWEALQDALYRTQSWELKSIQSHLRLTQLNEYFAYLTCTRITWWTWSGCKRNVHRTLHRVPTTLW